MNDDVLLRIDGEVERPLALRYDDLAAIDDPYKIADVAEVDPKRTGQGVWLEGVLQLAGMTSQATHLTLHASADDFHASVPLAAVRDRAAIVFARDGRPLAPKEGGPTRLLIRDFAECHADDVDECANVKFLDHIELTAGPGRDTRPKDDGEHEALHRGE
jgi:DMSO/TMAO reductase YedYZ molybdopterin-dependent catalytic subunit